MIDGLRDAASAPLMADVAGGLLYLVTCLCWAALVIVGLGVLLL